MSLATLIYLAEIFGTIKGVSITITILSGLVATILFLVISFTGDPGKNRFGDPTGINKDMRHSLLKLSKRLFAIAIVALVPAIFLPFRDVTLAMYVVPRVVEDPQFKQLGDKGLEALDAYLDNFIAEQKAEEK